MKKKPIIAILMAICTAAAPLTASILMGNNTVKAEAVWPGGISLSDPGESAIVMDVDTGTVLYNYNENDIHYPASITKIMTAYLACENSSLDEQVTFSMEAVYGIEPGSSSIARDVDEVMTMEQTLYGLMLESANECGMAIAEHIGGSVEGFADMMNAKAAELGCTNTHFVNPHGLPEDDHYTTAHDMALIASAAYKNETFARIVGTKQYTIPPTNKHSEPTYLHHQHAMLTNFWSTGYVYDYCLGGKTGYTDAAQHTLVTYARKDDMTLVCVIMNAPGKMHYVDTTNLFDYCFDNFTTYNISENARFLTEEKSKSEGMLGTVPELIYIDKAGKVTLPKTVDFSSATYEIVPSGEKNTNLAGRVVYSYGDRNVGGADLLYSEVTDVSPYPFYNLPVEKGGAGIEVARVDFRQILIVIAGVILALILIAVLIKQWSKFSVYRYKHMGSRKSQKPKYRSIKSTRGRRRPRRGRKIL